MLEKEKDGKLTSDVGERRAKPCQLSGRRRRNNKTRFMWLGSFDGLNLWWEGLFKAEDEDGDWDINYELIYWKTWNRERFSCVNRAEIMQRLAHATQKEEGKCKMEVDGAYHWFPQKNLRVTVLNRYWWFLNEIGWREWIYKDVRLGWCCGVLGTVCRLQRVVGLLISVRKNRASASLRAIKQTLWMPINQAIESDRKMKDDSFESKDSWKCAACLCVDEGRVCNLFEQSKSWIIEFWVGFC